jgi:flagellar biosynthesis protein FlhF
MKVKTYKAMDMQAAIHRIKEDLGPQAIILSTRKIVEGKRAFGLLGRPMVEVTAGLDVDTESRGQGPAVPTSDRAVRTAEIKPKMWDMVRDDIRDLRRDIADLSLTARGPESYLQHDVEECLQEFRWWASFMTRQWGRDDSGWPVRNGRETFLRLIRQGVKEVHALRIIERLGQQDREERGGETAAEDLFNLLSRLVRVHDPLTEEGPLVLALIGPTGVGKTTTVAKLAAQCALEENRRVALITNDTYRIAAVEQLRTYARIMQLPLEVVLRPEELTRALDGFQDKDVVLIDTGGRSPFDTVQMADLEAFVNADPRIKRLLLLGANTDARGLDQVVQRFTPLRPDGLAVTKLDEASVFGPLFSLALQKRLPFVFFTMGQRVPEDIRPATCEDVVCWTLRGLPTFFDEVHQAAGEC